MKQIVVVGVVCLVLGFAAGWVARPAGQEAAVAGRSGPVRSERAGDAGDGVESLATKTARARGEAADESGVRVRTRVIEDGEVVEDTEGSAMARQMQDRWHKAMLDRQRKKFDARIATLVADLGLDAGQEQALREFFESKVGEIDARMADSGGEDFVGARELAGLMRGDGLDDELAAILDPGQQEQYAELKERERVTRIDSRALKNLAKVNEVVGLREDQKVPVYDLLYEDAERDLDANKDVTTFMSVFTEGIGIEIDTDDLGFGEAIQMQMEAAGEDGEPADPGAWKQALQASQQQRIDERVERLEPVLDERQLEQYRAHLETRSSDLFGGVLMDVGEVEE